MGTALQIHTIGEDCLGRPIPTDIEANAECQVDENERT